jgi:protein-disulfide isomerase
MVVRREWFAAAHGARASDRKPVYINGWQGDLGKGIRLGPPNARVQFIEFSDFECPFCASLHKNLKYIRGRYPSSVALIYMHFPISTHRFAMLAARVAECAADQGHFEQMHDLLFEEQDLLGLKPWREYAAQAGVPNLAAFESCAEKTSPVRRIEADKQLGGQLDVQFTPTVIVNGWKLGRPPSGEELDAIVKAVLAGKSPIIGGT